MRVEVVYAAAPHQVDLVTLQLPEGATLQQALQASGVLGRHGLDAEVLGRERRVGIWGRPALLDAGLRERDRVEVYRPLTVDPKEARRLRYKRTRPVPPAKTPGAG